MNYTKSERLDYNLHRDNVCRQLGITHNQYNYLKRIGNKLHKLYEDECNFDVSEDISHQLELHRLYVKAEGYVAELKLFIFYQTDPRGATIYLDIKEIPNNNYTSAYCIY